MGSLPKISDQVISNESSSDVNGIGKKSLQKLVLGQEPPIAASSPELRTSDSNVIPDVSGSQSMAVSEGPLSPSDASDASSYIGIINPQTYSKDNPDILGTSNKEKSMIVSKKTRTGELTAETDSESTLKDIDDILL